MPAADSLKFGCLPLGLAHGWKLLARSPGTPVKWTDVAFDANNTAVRVRREMESGVKTFSVRSGAAAERVPAGRAR